jgi:hypothetical protein
MSISPRVLRLSEYNLLNALATNTQIAALEDSPFFMGNVIFLIVILTPSTE